MATTVQLSENSHQGFEGIKAALCLGSTEVNSNTASGMPLRLRQNCIRSRSSGKERDAETGLDYFGARYLSSAQGRFLSADPSSKGISLLDPQSWNRYSYVQNRTLSFVDGNGKWATPVHGDIIRTALQGYVSPGVMRELIARQAVMDKNLDLGGKEAFKHAMRGPGQNPAAAIQKTNGFILSKMSTHAVSDFGDALHTLQDYTSPLHTDASFNPKEWGGATIARVGLSHLLNENPSSDWSRFGLAVEMSMYAFMVWDSTAAKGKGLTESSFVGEYRKRISDYVDSYYRGLLSEMLGADPLNRSAIEHTIQTESEAARLCAMGAPAACVK